MLTYMIAAMATKAALKFQEGKWQANRLPSSRRHRSEPVLAAKREGLMLKRTGAYRGFPGGVKPRGFTGKQIRAMNLKNGVGRK